MTCHKAREEAAREGKHGEKDERAAKKKQDFGSCFYLVYPCQRANNPRHPILI